MNAPYALIPVATVVLLAYFFTLFLSKLKILGKVTHIRIWNYVLLITFLVSGLLGLLAVIKINYQLTVPHYEEWLRLHIHVGIGMVLVAFIHFFRHLNYYFSLSRAGRRQKKTTAKPDSIPEIQTRHLSWFLFLLGFVTFTAQLVLIREFVSIFTGNELVIGFFLSAWLILTGAGSLLARNAQPLKFSFRKIKILALLISFLPIIILFLVYWLKSNLFPPGTAIGPVEILSGIVLLLFPVCFLSGYLFVILTGIASNLREENRIAGSYITETFGSLAGGIVFSFFLVFIFRSFEVLALVFLLAGILSCLTGKSGRGTFCIITLVPVLLLTAAFTFRLDTRLKSLFFTNQKILYNKSGFTGNSVVTNQEGQLNFYTNNNLDFYTGNVTDVEEAAHYAMVQNEKSEKVLVVSGDAFAIAKEVLKYGVSQVDIIMMNKQYYHLASQFTSSKLPDEKIRKMAGDPIRLLRLGGFGPYDAVILNVPPPSTMKDNRFYTSEFFGLLKKCCSPEAVISLQLPSTSDYAGPEATGLNSVVYKTLRSAFREVALIRGEKNFYLAADKPLSLDIAQKITEKGIVNDYVNKNYINDQLLKERSLSFLSTLDAGAPVNRLLYPGAFLLHLREWLRMHGTFYVIFAAVPFFLLFLILIRQTPVRAGLVVSGFSASSLQIILITGFQLFFGNIFYQVSLFFAVFLTGLAAGTFLGQRQKAVLAVFNRWQLILALLAAFCPLVFLLFLNYPYLQYFSFVFHILNGVVASCLGYLFSLAARLETQEVTPRLSMNYSADLLGSAIGTYLASLFFIPVLGIVNSCLVAGGASFMSFLYTWIRRKRYV